jgi:hypothetical protein
MSRIQGRFQALARDKRKALIPYITAGDPHPSLTVPPRRAPTSSSSACPSRTQWPTDR